jgi:hypothetical protein
MAASLLTRPLYAERSEAPIQPLLELGNSLKKKKMRYQTIQYHREPLQMIKI